MVNALFELTDKQLREDTIRFDLDVWDSSDVWRGAENPETNMSFSIGNVVVSNVANYLPGDSSATATAPGSSSIWSFNGFSYSQVGDFYERGSSDWDEEILGTQELASASVSVADFNDDGYDDVLQLAYNGEARILFNQGPVDEWTDVLLPWLSRVAAVGDVNNDNLPDIVYGKLSYIGYPLNVVINDGNSPTGWVSYTLGTTITGTVKCLSLTDINNDTRPDVIMGLYGWCQDEIFINNDNNPSNWVCHYIGSNDICHLTSDLVIGDVTRMIFLILSELDHIVLAWIVMMLLSIRVILTTQTGRQCVWEVRRDLVTVWMWVIYLVMDILM